METLKYLKKRLAQLKSYRKTLPRLIDMSCVNGDFFFTQQDLEDAESRIEMIKSQIISLKSQTQ